MIKNSLKWLVIIVAVSFSINNIRANDGEKLFKNNCSACHKLEGTLIGPGLKGIKAKWAEAQEEDQLYLWVQNPAALYKSGNSEMAKTAWDFSPTEMTAQAHLSEEQIIQIFEYVESDIKEEVKTDPKIEANIKKAKIYTPEEIAIIKREHANKNRIVFFFLVVVGILLLAGIFSITKAIEAFCISTNKKDNHNKGSLGGAAGVILLLLILNPFNGFSLSFDPNNVKEGWLLVSNTDNLIFLVIDILLLLILWNQYKVLKSIAEHAGYKIKKSDSEPSKNTLQLLTGAVAIENEASILLDHDYDGIRELDNNMPPWWVWSFIASIIFAIAYLVHFHVIGTGDLQAIEYQKSIDKAQIEIDEYMAKMAMNVDENNVELLTKTADIENGKGLYLVNCIVCHKERGEGLVGPNLTDDYWLHGQGDLKTIFSTIKYGTNNGMPEHESKLNPIELQQVSSFILTMEYVEGKAPEGTKIEK